MDLNDPLDRFDVLIIYRGLADRVPDLFENDKPATRHVVEELKLFVQGRMASLMGVERSPEQRSILDELSNFTSEDVRRLKALAQGTLQPTNSARPARPAQASAEISEVAQPEVNTFVDPEEVVAVRTTLEQSLFQQLSFIREPNETPHVETVRGAVLDLYDRLETYAPLARMRLMREALAGFDTWKHMVIPQALRTLVMNHIGKIPRPSELAGYTDEALRKATTDPRAQAALKALSPQAAAAVTSERANEESSMAEQRFMSGAQAGTLYATGGQNNNS